MGTKAKLLIAAAAVGALSAPAFAQSSGPVATYWVSASTSTGMGGMMGQMGGQMGMPGQGGGDPSQPPQQQQPKPKRPGLGAMLGAAATGMIPGAGMFGGNRGGGDSSGGSGGGGSTGVGGGRTDYAAMMQGGGPPVRTLSLQLGSIDKPSGDPTAEHLIPSGLNMGLSLPLVTPVAPPPAKSEEGDYQMPDQMRQPQGKLLIYWGCGEHAAGPPIVIDFATVAQGQMPKLPTIEVKSEHPPSSGRSATYGSWPNMKDSQRVPNDASLVGDHMVRGDYSPDIHFHLGEDHDFMGPLTLNQEPTEGGALRLSWSPVQGATGYYAWLMGVAGKGGGGDGKTMVMWTSGMKASAFSALFDYLPPSEVRRLVAEQVVMAPQTTECIVPEEVRNAGAMGMLSMIAYGDEVNFADPPRPSSAKAPWNLKYVVKVRFKSTTSLMMGLDQKFPIRQ